MGRSILHVLQDGKSESLMHLFAFCACFILSMCKEGVGDKRDCLIFIVVGDTVGMGQEANEDK